MVNQSQGGGGVMDMLGRVKAADGCRKLNDGFLS